MHSEFNRARTDPMPVICYLQRHSIRPGWDTSVVGDKPRRAEFSICNYVVGNIDSKPSVRGTERSWINGGTILWPESNTNRYRRRYPSPRIGFFYCYYWCTRFSSGMSCFIMRGGALPFELFPGHQFPSCGGTDTCAKYTTRREQARYEGPRGGGTQSPRRQCHSKANLSLPSNQLSRKHAVAQAADGERYVG